MDQWRNLPRRFFPRLLIKQLERPVTPMINRLRITMPLSLQDRDLGLYGPSILWRKRCISLFADGFSVFFIHLLFIRNIVWKKGMALELTSMAIKEGETSPPKRYTSGSMILAMENAGQLIEDEELRAQIKGSGIGTSATRAEILKKLVSIKYLALNKKTQVITPTLLGELIFDVVGASIRQLLNPELTASWEKGLTYVAEGSITSDEYMEKLERFVAGRTYGVMNLQNQYVLRECFDRDAVYYKKSGK